jgi:CheY-like chemotaxis protein
MKSNLLIVEDDVHLRTLLAAILTQSGHRVRAAEDGFSALDQIRADTPDLVLSDLYMAGMSGFELLSVVRRRFPAIPVIAMSSAFAGEEIPAGVAADAFYPKATGIKPLLSLVDETARLKDLPPAKRPRRAAPIWIATDAPADGTPVPIVITCPECLRTSEHEPDEATTVVRKTDCDHCRTSIDYAIVHSTESGTPQVLRGNTATQTSNSSAA